MAKYGLLIITVLTTLIVAGCGTPKKTVVVETPSQPHFEDVPQEGQLPYEVVSEASKRHGGSMDTEEVKSASGEQPSGLVVVMGPVTSEKGMVSIDAGQKVREVIAMIITSENDITLVDAPEERYKDDSPRPDLAKRGIKAVIKGVASYSKSSEKITVFLRSVDTATGNVMAIGAGRNNVLDDAATEAATLLIEKIKGAEQ